MIDAALYLDFLRAMLFAALPWPVPTLLVVGAGVAMLTFGAVILTVRPDVKRGRGWF